MAKQASFLDHTGLPMQPASPARRVSASLGGSAPQFFPYDAANWSSQEMGNWLPWIRSPDTEISVYRDRMVARTRDLVRNDGWASGAVTRILDSTIGATYRMTSNPDYRALSLFNKGFDPVWAAEFRQAAEALWRGYSEDIERYSDVTRQLTIAQQFRLALRHKLIDGEGLALTYWLPERQGPGAAQYATAFQIVDPDRLSNPYQGPDTKYMRNGVEIDDNGAPIAYHIRRAHQNDWYNSVEAMEWDRVEREDPDGWRRVIHDYDRDRAGQSRGVSVFAPILSRLKMLATYYGVELQAATVASAFGTYITSPYDDEMVEQALDDGGQEKQSFYQGLRREFHDSRALQINGARIPTLAPGEDIKAVSVARPNAAFSPFTHEMLRGLAAVLGISGEQVTWDYSQTNYSSARAAIVESEKTYNRRCDEFNANVATPVYAAWLEEAMDRKQLPLPSGAPRFIEARNAYARCRWLGPAKGWVDPVAERQGAILGLDAGFSTLEQECAEQGLDWEENLEQRARERKRMDELGLPHPEWMGEAVTAFNASQAAQKPEKPEAA